MKKILTKIMYFKETLPYVVWTKLLRSIHFTKISRGYSGQFLKEAAEITVIGKSAFVNDLPNAGIGIDKHLLGVGHTAGPKIFHNRNPRCSLKSVGQSRDTNVVLLCENIKVVLLGVFVFKLTFEVNYNIVVSVVKIYRGASANRDKQLLDQ